MQGGEGLCPRAKLSYQERLWLQEAFEKKMDPLKICEHFGISSYQLDMERKLGWMKEKKAYSAKKAQYSLK